jgi:hypothetical protein
MCFTKFEWNADVTARKVAELLQRESISPKQLEMRRKIVETIEFYGARVDDFVNPKRLATVLSNLPRSTFCTDPRLPSENSDSSILEETKNLPVPADKYILRHTKDQVLMRELHGLVFECFETKCTQSFHTQFEYELFLIHARRYPHYKRLETELDLNELFDIDKDSGFNPFFPLSLSHLLVGLTPFENAIDKLITYLEQNMQLKTLIISFDSDRTEKLKELSAAISRHPALQTVGVYCAVSKITADFIDGLKHALIQDLRIVSQFSNHPGIYCAHLVRNFLIDNIQRRRHCKPRDKTSKLTKIPFRSKSK